MDKADAWGELVGLFTGGATEDGIPKGAADNILLGWPPILHTMQIAFGRTDNLDVLDFGCGAGDFCRHLHSLGNRVWGVDSSPGMLEAASRRIPAQVTLLTPEQLWGGAKRFDVVTAIMVFQFVGDIEGVLSRLVGMLQPSGTLVFAVFNPAFTAGLAEQGRLFHSFDSATYPAKGIMEVRKGVQVPVFVRTADHYAEMLCRLNCAEIARITPPFTPAFLARYPVWFPVRDPEFLVQGFTKR
ncbi:MAG: class I SAM-dependent methyltransferase [Planctomycetota bacterium]|nr:class I SAM-dependent methyltransferase [Planctomycetota bacterium]